MYKSSVCFPSTNYPTVEFPIVLVIVFISVPQECVVCGRLAEFHCKDCFTVGRTDNDCSGNFCGECNKRIHSHNRRAKHNFRPLVVSREMRQYCGQSHIEPLEMELFAVVCIETSHYVAFTKCENNEGEWRWCFFDSMADRKGEYNPNQAWVHKALTK